MSGQGIIDIPEGRMNDYLVHGLFVLIGGGILALVHWSLTVFMVVLAVALFSVRSGIEIDLEGRRARVYKALGGLRFGAWHNLAAYSNIDVRYTNEAQVMNSRGSSTNVRVRTYDLHFTNNEGALILFHEFTDYAKALKCAKLMAKHWSLAFIDEVEERRLRAQTNASARKR